MSDARSMAKVAENAAIEANYRDFYHVACARISGARIHEDAEVGWAITGSMHPMLNVVFASHWAPELAPEQVRDRIEATLAPFREQQLPMLWCLWPSSQPSDLGAHLQESGLFLASSLPGMARDLAQPLPAIPSIDGLQIELVRDDEMWDQWLTTCSTGFEFSEQDQSVLRPVFRQLGYTEPIFQYLGRLNGEAVATASLLLRNGVAGIYNVATLPQARRKGIGGALTLAALHYAQQQGCSRAILLASASGYPVYEQLGFRETCMVPQYVWAPGSAPD